jgi:hypothetical protein
MLVSTPKGVFGMRSYLFRKKTRKKEMMTMVGMQVVKGKVELPPNPGRGRVGAEAEAAVVGADLVRFDGELLMAPMDGTWTKHFRSPFE